MNLFYPNLFTCTISNYLESRYDDITQRSLVAYLRLELEDTLRGYFVVE